MLLLNEACPIRNYSAAVVLYSFFSCTFECLEVKPPNTQNPQIPENPKHAKPRNTRKSQNTPKPQTPQNILKPPNIAKPQTPQNLQTPQKHKTPTNTPKLQNTQNPNISEMAERRFPKLLHVIDGRR